MQNETEIVTELDFQRSRSSSLDINYWTAVAYLTIWRQLDVLSNHEVTFTSGYS
jgi:hypothetical protein